MGGIIVGTMALVIILSVFNGFTQLIGTFYSNFDPDLKITPVKGKMFDPATADFETIKNMPEVADFAEIIEDVGLLKYRNQVYPAIVKGVPENYSTYTNIDSLIVDGSFLLKNNDINYAVVGQGIAYALGIRPAFTDAIVIVVPRSGAKISLNPANAINQSYVFPSGIFAVLEEIDSKYMIVSLPFARDLFNSGKKISSVELDIANGENIEKVQKKIAQILGDNFEIKNQYQQHDLIFKTMESEKWVAYLILIFILIIAAFNILGSLSMLIIDKKDDIMILRSMGATPNTIRNIFLLEGWLITIIGAIMGTLLGIFLCWLQLQYGIIQLTENQTFLISAYPVQLRLTDVLLVLSMVILIGFFAAWYPVKYISQKNLLPGNI